MNPSVGEGKMEKGNSTKIIVSVVVFVALVAVAFLVFGGSRSRVAQGSSGTVGTTSNTMSGQGSTSSGSQQTQQIKLLDTKYRNYAYLISGATMDTATQRALAGFQVQKESQSDGSVKITLNALESQYHDQQYIVKPGQKLYFIETSFGDDSGTNGVFSLGDDGAVILDANGYITQ